MLKYITSNKYRNKNQTTHMKSNGIEQQPVDRDNRVNIIFQEIYN